MRFGGGVFGQSGAGRAGHRQTREDGPSDNREKESV